jgi:hypothetical protein
MSKLINTKTGEELTPGDVPIGVKRWSKNNKLIISIGRHIELELTEFESEWLTYYLTKGTHELPNGYIEEFRSKLATHRKLKRG